jgi:mannose-1-phosphate guanylyltransferase
VLSGLVSEFVAPHIRGTKIKAPGAMMRQLIETWAVVLAGGEGTRLRKMTTNRQGIVIPKQYCSLDRSSCLLQDAITRSGSVAMPSHICTVVAAQHRQWWTSAVTNLNPANVFVQPQNKGTAVGVLLALLTLEMRNPQATVVLLPADHYFREEDSITRGLRAAANLARANSSSTYLLGTDPDSPDTELGYILPKEECIDKPASIVGFTEKPNTEFAKELISLGAMWNLFILVGSVNSLLQLFAEEHAGVVYDLREALKCNVAGWPQRLDEFYARIEPMDFSHDILEVQANRLQVIRVPNCGWTDLGTPKRVEATVRSIVTRADRRRARSAHNAPLFFDLGSQCS